MLPRCLTREARENVKIGAETAGEANETLNFVAHLRRSSQFTAGLLLRGLLCGNKHLLETALCELSGLAMPRVIALVAESKSAGFAVLYRKAQCRSTCCLFLSRVWRRSRNPVVAGRNHRAGKARNARKSRGFLDRSGGIRGGACGSLSIAKALRADCLAAA